jgi:GT2 family glycosyltransferase
MYLDGVLMMVSCSQMVGIVILNWNNYDVTSRCLHSLKDIEYSNHVIYLVDNASTDNSMERLKEEFSKEKLIIFIQNTSNLGFAAGCNSAISQALDDGCQYILLLNNDCIIGKKDFLNHAVSIGEGNPKCGIVGGKILFWPDIVRIWSTGGYISYWGGEIHIGYQEIDSGQYDVVLERKFISGALMLIKREVIENIGMLPDVYFFGKEEWEYSTCAIKAGYKLIYNPQFCVFHEASNSHDWIDPTYVYNGTLSKILYKKRNLPYLNFLIWWFAYAAYLVIFFPVKYNIQKNKYLKGIAFKTMRTTMQKALLDSIFIHKITEESLNNFRKKYVIPKRG